MTTATDNPTLDPIKSELKRRMDLVNNPKFVKECIGMLKKLGITAKEWNENKASIILLLANETIKAENAMNRQNKELKYYGDNLTNY
jgi:hypothetical protein